MMDMSEWFFDAFMLSLCFSNCATLIHTYSMKKQVETLSNLVKMIQTPKEAPAPKVRTPEQKFRAAQRKREWWMKKKASESANPKAITKQD